MDDKGHVPAGGDAFVKVGLTGALLAELAIDGQLTVGDDGKVRTGDTRPCDELLADVYDAVRNHLEGRKASLDGRLDGFPADAGLYYEMASRLPHQAVLTGSGTMLAAAAGQGSRTSG